MKNLKTISLLCFILLLQAKIIAQDKTIVPQESNGYIFDKVTTDEFLKKDVAYFKEKYNIDINFSNIKRNLKGEIIAIKIAYNDNNGNSDEIRVTRKIAIRPIFFRVKLASNGKDGIGFYDNHEMIKKPINLKLEKTISTIESFNDDAVIYVDNEKYRKEDVELLDPKSLVKIETIKKITYITTNWKTKK